MNKFISIAAAIILLLFGLLTLFLSTSVIADLFNIREREGNYVLFVVWANFLSGFLYLSAAYGFYKVKNWTLFSLATSFIILSAAFLGLIYHANSGGLYESKTIFALAFRMTFTAVFTIFAYFHINKKKNYVR